MSLYRPLYQGRTGHLDVLENTRTAGAAGRPPAAGLCAAVTVFFFLARLLFHVQTDGWQQCACRPIDAQAHSLLSRVQVQMRETMDTAAGVANPKKRKEKGGGEKVREKN